MVEGLSSYDQMASSEADMTYDAWPSIGLSGLGWKEVKHETFTLCFIFQTVKSYVWSSTDLLDPTRLYADDFLTVLFLYKTHLCVCVGSSFFWFWPLLQSFNDQFIKKVKRM